MRPPRFSDDPTLPHHTACRASSTLHLPFPPPPCRSHRRGAALGVQFVNAQIPLGTQHFAFFYPVFSARDCALDPNVAMESLLLNGGFVYFDGLKPVQGKWQSSILGINVICPEGSAGILQFDGPYPLGPEAQRELQHQERMQPVTLAAIRGVNYRPPERPRSWAGTMCPLSILSVWKWVTGCSRWWTSHRVASCSVVSRAFVKSCPRISAS